MSTSLSYLVAARRCEIADLGHLSRTCDLIRVVSDLIHCLQHERGVSNQYLASRGQRNSAQRIERMAATDTALANMLTMLDLPGEPAQYSGGARLYTKVALALHALGDLPALRVRVGSMACSPEENTSAYKGLITALLALVFEAADVAVDPDISRLLIALFHLMQGKEFAGQERATGAAAYAAGRIDADQRRSLEYLIEMQVQALQRFESFAARLQREWQVLQASLPLAELDRMRRSMLTAPGGVLDAALSDDWFSCCSRRMDELHHVEIHIAELLQTLCSEKTEALKQELDAQQQALPNAAFAVAVSPLVAFSANVPPDGLAGSEQGGVGPHLAHAMVDMLHTQTARLQNLTEELATVRLALEERKLIDRAKGILMTHQGLDEESAYRFLRKKAMDHNQRVVDVARSVLSLAELARKS